MGGNRMLHRPRLAVSAMLALGALVIATALPSAVLGAVSLQVQIPAIGGQCLVVDSTGTAPVNLTWRASVDGGGYVKASATIAGPFAAQYCASDPSTYVEIGDRITL